MRVYNLIRDLTADAYGGWHLVVALQAGGGLSAQRVMMNRIYDMAGAKARRSPPPGRGPAEADGGGVGRTAAAALLPRRTNQNRDRRRLRDILAGRQFRCARIRSGPWLSSQEGRCYQIRLA